MFNEIPIFEQILGSNFTTAINSSLHTFSNLHNLTERDIGERERERGRKTRGRMFGRMVGEGDGRSGIAVRWCVPEQCWLVDTWPLAR